MIAVKQSSAERNVEGKRWLDAIVQKGRDIYEVEGANSSKRIQTMEGLRGLAVLLVFGVHYHALFGEQLPHNAFAFAFSYFWERIGLSGVDLFFVLSGYLIYGIVIKRPTDNFRFILRRVERIYPTFLCVFGIYLILSAIFPGENKIPANITAATYYILENIFLLPGIVNVQPIITVAWSLSYEFFFYLFLPLLVAILSLRSWSRSQRVLFFVALACVYTACCLAGIYPRIHLIMFISGILVYEILNWPRYYQQTRTRNDYYGLIAVGITFPMLYLISRQPNLMPFVPGKEWMSGIYQQIILFVGFSAFVLFSLNANSILKNILSWLPLRWLGNMSYSYYLIHGLTLKAIAFVVSRGFIPLNHPQIIFWLGLPFCIFMTLLVATILFVTVEKRFSLKSKAPVITQTAAPTLTDSAGIALSNQDI